MITIDSGAAEAILSGKASLLASGIIAVEGDFMRGDGVRCCLADGTEIMRGIIEYSHNEINKIAGCKSAEIEQILGFRHRRGAIHRDNLVIL